MRNPEYCVHWNGGCCSSKGELCGGECDECDEWIDKKKLQKREKEDQDKELMK